MSIRIEKASASCSLVALPRDGYRRWGIGPGGAMDSFAMTMANALVGNDDEAMIEVGLSNLVFRCDETMLLAVTGQGYDVLVNDQFASLWKPLVIKANSRIEVRKKPGGMWAYLAIAGGWKADTWLKSKTTNIAAKRGGFNGRSLLRDDELKAEQKSSIKPGQLFAWGIASRERDKVYAHTSIRIVPSVEWNWLDDGSKQKIISKKFSITPQSNRMGYRLSGPVLERGQKTEMVSSAVDVGMLQLLPSGQLIALMADHQTTGGYPRIGSIIPADLPRFAQLQPGDSFLFEVISHDNAEREFVRWNAWLGELQRSCHLKLQMNHEHG